MVFPERKKIVPVLDFDISFQKQPSEQLTIRLDLGQILSSLVASGYALSAADLKVFDSSGTDVTASMVSGAPTIDAVNNYVFALIIDGTDAKDYFGRLKTTWTKAGQPDQVIETDLLIQVRQKGF